MMQSSYQKNKIVTTEDYKLIDTIVKISAQKVFCEKSSGFTEKYQRMAACCEDLVASIALIASCEMASVI